MHPCDFCHEKSSRAPLGVYKTQPSQRNREYSIYVSFREGRADGAGGRNPNQSKLIDIFLISNFFNFQNVSAISNISKQNRCNQTPHMQLFGFIIVTPTTMARIILSVALLSIACADALVSVPVPTRNSIMPPAQLILKPMQFEKIRKRNVRTVLDSAAIESSESVESENDLKQGLAAATFNLVKANLGTGVFTLPVSTRL